MSTLLERATWPPARYLAGSTTGGRTGAEAVACASRLAAADSWELDRGAPAPAPVLKDVKDRAREAAQWGCDPEAVVRAAALTPTLAARYEAGYRAASGGRPAPVETTLAAIREARSLLSQGLPHADVFTALDAAAAKASRYVTTAYNDLVQTGLDPTEALEGALAWARARDRGEVVSTAQGTPEAELVRALSMLSQAA